MFDGDDAAEGDAELDAADCPCCAQTTEDKIRSKQKCRQQRIAIFYSVARGARRERRGRSAKIHYR